jgi:hypothetical protein
MPSGRNRQDHASEHVSLLMERCTRCGEPILPGERYLLVTPGAPTAVERLHPACRARAE